MERFSDGESRAPEDTKIARVNRSSNHHLILITNHFPFGEAEAFLEQEISYLTSRFDKVIVVARDTTSTGQRPGNFIAHRLNPVSSTAEKLGGFWLLLKKFPTVSRFLTTEVHSIRARQRSVSAAIIGVMLHDLMKALITARDVERIIRQHQLRGTIVTYSYWLTNSALTLLFLDSRNNKMIRLSRAHGGDVYEFRHKTKYLSFRSVLVRNLDAIFCISENGKDHLKNFTDRNDAAKLKIARLGTKGGFMRPPQPNATQFVVVSCAYMLPVKRIDLLIRALAEIRDLRIRWIHIGDGPLRHDLEALAMNKLGSNIEVQFKGSLTNTDLIRFYEQNFVHLFVNTSESEGIPVTIMEAQSFGIPVLAPRIGGIPEIVSASNGKLFEPDAQPQAISGHIRELVMAPNDVYQKLRENAWTNWNERYNAEKNFPTFVTEILNLAG